jgi:hypothetical protein
VSVRRFAAAGGFGDGAVDGALVKVEADDPVVGGQRDLLEPGEDVEPDPLIASESYDRMVVGEQVVPAIAW